MMGLSELIAEDENGYIARVLKLAKDHDYRDAIGRKIIDRKQVLYRDMSTIYWLENFLAEKLRHA